MKHVVIVFVFFVVTWNKILAWKAPIKCDGKKNPDWLKCNTMRACTLQNNVPAYSSMDCPSKDHWFNPADGNCTLNVTGTATCLNDGFSTKGVTEFRHNMTFYRVGSGSECVIWNYDIAGMSNHRTKIICDVIANQGYQVILPDYFNGTHANLGPMTNWTEVQIWLARQNNPVKLANDIDNRIMPYGRSLGCTSYKTVGTCWGSYMVLMLSEYDVVKGGVSMHPSHQNILGNMGVNITEYVTQKAKCPQLYLVAGNDPPSVKWDGLYKDILGDNLEVVEYPAMAHGWTTRGDMSNETIREGIYHALNSMMDFLKDTPTFVNPTDPPINSASLNSMYLSGVWSVFLALAKNLFL